jgi:NTP pyrophosphatase (non-canonical NTP hydrolase)
VNAQQKKIDQWFAAKGWHYWAPLSILARLYEEGGELARIINHLYGEKRKRADEPMQEIKEEIGDMLYTLACLANQHSIDVDDALDASIQKVMKRDADRYQRDAP